MKRLIYQVYLGKRSKLYDHCIDSVKKYCQKHGIDHHIQSEPILKILPDMSRTNRNKNGLMKEMGYLPIYEKENAFDFLKPVGEYDQVAVIDADIYIRENASNIFDELGPEFDFGGVVEREMPLSKPHRNKIRGYSNDMFKSLTDVDWKWNDDGAEFMNMGMMLMNASLRDHLGDESPEQFIRRPEFRDFVDGIGYWKFSSDQVILNYWIKKDGIRAKNLHWKWNTMYRGVEDKYIKDGQFIHFFLKQQLPARGENISQLMAGIGK